MPNLAAAYGVTFQTAPETVAAWRVEVVRHLSPLENRSKRNLYVDVVDEYGRRVFDNRLRIAWLTYADDKIADLTPLDKSDSPIEMGDGNVDLYTSQTLTAWITGDGLASDRVVGIHTRHPDEPLPSGEIFNSYGHHSFHVRFKRSAGVVVVPPVVVDPPKPNPDSIDFALLFANVAAMRKQLDEHEALLRNMQGEL